MSYAPCKGCKERTAECHGKCERYKEFQKEMEKVKENRKNDSIRRSTMFRPKYYN